MFIKKNNHILLCCGTFSKPISDRVIMAMRIILGMDFCFSSKVIFERAQVLSFLQHSRVKLNSLSEKIEID